MATPLPRVEGRVPPHDLEAEASVLGAILLDPMAIARVLELVIPEDFYRENNAQIFRAATELFREGEPIDNVTLAAQLEKMGVLERVGGRAHLAMLQEQTPTAANVEHYARIVKARAYKRSLITAGGQVSALGYDDSVEAEEAINQAQSHVYAIAEHRVGAGMERLYDLLKPAMDKIDAQMASGGGVVGIASGFHDLDRVTNGFKPSDMVVIAGRPSMGKCLIASTLIDDPTTGQRVTVEECVHRRLPCVMGMSDGGHIRATRIGDWVDSGVQECFRVRTRLGRSVEVTGHHPFLTVDGWQPLHDLAAGDRIGLPRRVPAFGTDSSWDPALVRLLAYYVAEGGLTSSSAAFSNADPEIVADFREAIASHFPDLRVVAERVTYHAVAKERGRRNPLITWLRDTGLWGKGAHEKRFPSSVWRWDRSRLVEFVRALMSCDGTIYDLGGYPRIEFAVASRELAEDLQHALVRLGIVAKLWQKKERCWRLDITEPRSVAEYQCEVGWIGEKASRFPHPPVSERRSNLGQLPASVWSLVRASAAERQLTLAGVARAAGDFGSTRRGFNMHVSRGLPPSRLGAYARVLQDAHLLRLASPDLYWDEIVSIEPIGKHQVYDLTVPDGANFIAQDVVVHNTSFVLNVTLNAAVEQKQPVAIFSLEMSKEQLVERMLCEQARIDAQRLHRGLLSEAEHERLVYALGPLGDAPIFIDDSPMLDDLTLRLKARQAKARDGIELVIVDYLQLMHGRVQADDGNRVQEVSHISRSMKAIARELRVPVIAISQLSRAPEARPDKRPILSDLRESGCLTGDTLVYLPDEGGHRRLDELVGKTGFRVLALDPHSWYLEPRVVTNSFWTGRKPVHRLRTSSGRTIRATANHKFLAASGWTRLDELATGDHVALPRWLPGPEKESLPQSELALLGLLIGDGCTLPRHTLQYTTTDPSLGELAMRLADEVFPDALRPVMKRERGWYQVYFPSARRLTHGRRNPISAWLDQLGAFGYRSYEKFVPDEVFRQATPGVAAFLRHLWATDGCIHAGLQADHQPAIYYATSSRRLAEGVQSLLLRFEINAALRTIPQGERGRVQHHVTVGGRREMLRFLEEISTVGKDRHLAKAALVERLETQPGHAGRDVVPAGLWSSIVRPALIDAGITHRQFQGALGLAYCGHTIFEHNQSRPRARQAATALGSDDLMRVARSDVYWDKVVSIEPDGEEDVYDLTVDGLHNFVANDMILHNSIEQDADLVMFLYRDEYYNREKSEKQGIAEILVAKHRNGPTGSVELAFRKELTRFENLDRRRAEVETAEP